MVTDRKPPVLKDQVAVVQKRLKVPLQILNLVLVDAPRVRNVPDSRDNRDSPDNPATPVSAPRAFGSHPACEQR